MARFRSMRQGQLDHRRRGHKRMCDVLVLAVVLKSLRNDRWVQGEGCLRVSTVIASACAIVSAAISVVVAIGSTILAIVSASTTLACIVRNTGGARRSNASVAISCSRAGDARAR